MVGESRELYQYNVRWIDLPMLIVEPMMNTSQFVGLPEGDRLD